MIGSSFIKYFVLCNRCLRANDPTATLTLLPGPDNIHCHDWNSAELIYNEVCHQPTVCLECLNIALNRNMLASVQPLASLLSLWQFVINEIGVFHCCDNLSSLWHASNGRVFRSRYCPLASSQNRPTLFPVASHQLTSLLTQMRLYLV